MTRVKEVNPRLQTVSVTGHPASVILMRLWLFYCLLLLATAPKVLADDPHPLAPPDRSSPRATLQSFITHMDAAHRAYVGGADSGDAARAFRRAINCFDLSDVAPTLHFDVGGFSALLLQEILDR